METISITCNENERYENVDIESSNFFLYVDIILNMPEAKDKNMTKKPVRIERGQSQSQSRSQRESDHIHMEKAKTRRKQTRKKENIVKQPPSCIQPSVTSGSTHLLSSSMTSTPAP